MKNDLTIFYTDDDQDDLEVFKEIVEEISSSFNVVTQSNGLELLHALDNPPPTPYLIFLDINMPGINGFDVLKKVRESATHKELPIVMFSTSNDEATIERSRSLGASFYMPKSGIFNHLKKSIEHALSINWATNKNFVYTF